MCNCVAVPVFSVSRIPASRSWSRPKKARRECSARSSKCVCNLGGAQVTVLSGRVGVTADRDAPQQILTAGQQVAYGQGTAEKLHAVDSEAQLAWRQGWLNYYKASLADVVQDLRRYYPGRIVVLNDELAARKVSGSFPSKDPQAVLSSLQGVMGFEQHQVLGHLIIVR